MSGKVYEVRKLDPTDDYSFWGIWDRSCGDWHRWPRGEPAEYASRSYAEKFCHALNTAVILKHRRRWPRPDGRKD